MSDLGRKLDSLKIDRDEQPPTRRGLGIAVAALLLLALLAVLWWLRREPVTAVTTAQAVPAAGSPGGGTVLDASGYVTARRQATVSSKVTGKVVEVRIEEGMRVSEGQVLARLDDTNVAAAVRLAAAELAAARTALAETRVRLDEARRERERTAHLESAGVASRRQLDQASAEADSLAARLESQQEAVVVGERRLAVQRQLLEDTVIRAPFDGVVVAKNAQPGEMISPVSAGGGFTRTGIGTLVDMESLEIEVDVNEAYIQRVAPGQAVIATLDAYPDWRIPARVIAIIPTADRQRATVQVRVGFDELDARILPEMGVKVAFQSGSEPVEASAPGVEVPLAAVRRSGDRDLVFVVTDDRVERRAVAVTQRGAAVARVVSGLAAGERVVVDPPPDLADGARVKEVNR
ncbi:MAG: efflux RND transporter periplasmic adaptor subunit [Thermoanaerobaculia bacterium]|nr:efflux RND transporter periplasmic adaptor subunit [Thermoanaerobaculia bacterium]